ncbi:hypothetical protein BKA80DRAFT_62678 [Phyllosticta citrichinensis]
MTTTLKPPPRHLRRPQPGRSQLSSHSVDDCLTQKPSSYSAKQTSAKPPLLSPLGTSESKRCPSFPPPPLSPPPCTYCEKISMQETKSPPLKPDYEDAYENCACGKDRKRDDGEEKLARGVEEAKSDGSPLMCMYVAERSCWERGWMRRASSDGCVRVREEISSATVKMAGTLRRSLS